MHLGVKSIDLFHLIVSIDNKPHVDVGLQQEVSHAIRFFANEALDQRKSVAMLLLERLWLSSWKLRHCVLVIDFRHYEIKLLFIVAVLLHLVFILV